ncbi:MAG TPA: aldo/keto reductase, partial [Candidatus Limnocylindrales bacterium]
AAAPRPTLGAPLADMPGFVEPMTAALAVGPFSDPDWLFELKWDGYRVQAHVRDGRVALFTRRGLDAAEYFPELAGAPTWIDAREAILDGEVVALNADGEPDFGLLQTRRRVAGRQRPGEAASPSTLVYQAFDLLYLDGRSLLGEPLESRKRLLRSILRDTATIPAGPRPADHGFKTAPTSRSAAAQTPKAVRRPPLPRRTNSISLGRTCQCLSGRRLAPAAAELQLCASGARRLPGRRVVSPGIYGRQRQAPATIEHAMLPPIGRHRAHRRPQAVSSVPTVKLNNGVEIPQLGFGVFQIPPQETRAATLEALRIGYRHIDTAEGYGNEREVGQAVRDSGLDRAEVFVTSKLNNGFHARDRALGAFDRSLEVMNFDYLDLFLIHWPTPAVGDFVETWKTLEEIYRSGRVRAIGVSNFQTHHLERLAAANTTVPAVNQIEIHPYFVQDDLRAFNREHEIATEAWSPIAQGAVLDDPTIARIADRSARTPAQVTLRWHIQRGDIVFPKSVSPVRMAENFAIFDFELSDEDMAAITALHRNGRRGPDPDEFN